jgi:hypothetical protein
LAECQKTSKFRDFFKTIKGEAKMITNERLNVAVHGIEIRQNPSTGRRVSPGKKPVKKSEIVEWRNVAPETVRVTFPNAGDVFEDFPSGGYAEIESARADRYHIRKDAVHGEYPYQVVSVDTGDYYVGDSDPRIDVL